MRILHIVFLSLICLTFAACNQKQNPENLKEKTAQATQEMKQDAKAVAQGVREGWNRDKPLNLNTASKEDLMSLPGMTSEWAEAIVVARPYDTPRDVVKRRIVPQSEYDKIADRVTTSGGKPSPGI